MTRARRDQRHGLSLLEVMLAIAILGGCVVVIGEFVRLGVRQAEESRDLSKGQLICESKMEEVAAGVLPAESISMAPDEYDPAWLYSITVTPLQDDGLIEVRVSVEQAETTRLHPLTFNLVRWMLDPALEELSEEMADEMGTDETAADDSTTDNSASSDTSGSTPAGETGGGAPAAGGGDAGSR